MTHRVTITQKAKDDLRHYYAVAAQHAPTTAARWLNRFETTLQTLSENPTRCLLAPENDLVDQPIYQLFYGKRRGRYRALFTEGAMQRLAHALLQSQEAIYVD